MSHLYQPALYRIVVGGHIGEGGIAHWSHTLICQHSHTAAGKPLTTLEGKLPDQAALHGILTHIRDRGLALHLVQCLEDDCLTIQDNA